MRLVTMQMLIILKKFVVIITEVVLEANTDLEIFVNSEGEGIEVLRPRSKDPIQKMLVIMITVQRHYVCAWQTCNSNSINKSKSI